MRMCLAVAMLLLAPVSVAAISVTDDLGRTVTVPAPAGRIISLAPHLTEVLFDLGVGDRIVGTVRFSNFPEAARAIPRLGDAFTLNVESVLAAAPDVVFAWQSGGTYPVVERLIELGIPVYVNEAPRLDNIARSVVAMASLVGKPERGRALAASFRQRIRDARADDVDRRDVKVFFQIADEQLFTVSDEHLIGQSIAVCGARNAFAVAPVAVPMVTQEAVIAAKPDLIVMTRAPDSPPSAWVDKWRSLPGFDVRIADIDPNLISRPGLRMADGIEALCKLIDAAASETTPGLR